MPATALFQKRLALILCGLSFISRAVIELVFHPDYYEPRTRIDHAAVILMSLSLITLAWALWGSFIKRPNEPGRAELVMRIALFIACISAMTAGISNFIEDWFDINALGMVWVVGILTLTAAMLVAGISAFWVSFVPRWKVVLLAAGSVAFVFFPIGHLLLGAALIGMALSRPKTNLVLR